MKARQLLANCILYEVSGNDVSHQAEKDLHFSRSHNAFLIARDVETVRVRSTTRRQTIVAKAGIDFAGGLRNT
jgi:hypothetical protein